MDSLTPGVDAIEGWPISVALNVEKSLGHCVREANTALVNVLGRIMDLNQRALSFGGETSADILKAMCGLEARLFDINFIAG